MRNAVSVSPYHVDRAEVAAAAAAIRQHLHFHEAIRRYTAAALDGFEGKPRAAKMICQLARYTLALAILYLDSSAAEDGGHGATPSRLRAMLTTGDFISARWVKSGIQVFQRVGYLYELPSPDDRRFKRVAPSTKLIEIVQEAITPVLQAAECVVALPLPAADLARIPGFVGAVASHTMVPYLADGFTPLEAFPEVRSLALRDFGFIVLCCLIRTLRRSADGSPLAQAPSVMLSRLFGMSRAQVRNVLDLCRNAGWIVAIGRGGREIRLAPHFADLCERWVAHDLACWSRIVRAACYDLGLLTANFANSIEHPAQDLCPLDIETCTMPALLEGPPGTKTGEKYQLNSASKYQLTKVDAAK
jgi:hypothetical protein